MGPFVSVRIGTRGARVQCRWTVLVANSQFFAEALGGVDWHAALAAGDFVTPTVEYEFCERETFQMVLNYWVYGKLEAADRLSRHTMKQIVALYEAAENLNAWNLRNECATWIFNYCTNTYHRAIETFTYLKENPEVGGSLNYLIVQEDFKPMKEWMAYHSQFHDLARRIYAGELRLDIMLCLHRAGKKMPDLGYSQYIMNCMGANPSRFCDKYHVHRQHIP